MWTSFGLLAPSKRAEYLFVRGKANALRSGPL